MRRRVVAGVLAVTLAVSAMAAACGSPRRGEPLVGPPELKTEELRRGERVFFVYCNQCHPGGEGGLGPALNNKPLPAAAMRLQVRKGLGVMPSFSENAIPDEDLDAVVKYLLLLRHAD